MNAAITDKALASMVSGAAEAAVVGGLFISPHTMESVQDLLLANDFSDAQLGAAYRAMLEVFQESGPSALNILNVADRMGILAANGGVQVESPQSYLMGVVSSTPDTLNLSSDATKIGELSVRRAVHETAREIANLAAFGTEYPIARVVELAEMKLLEAMQRVGSRDAADVGLRHLSVFAELSERRYQDIKSGGFAKYFTPTGFANLDKYITGFERSTLTLLVARPSKGKTSFALSCALHSAQEQKKRIGFFSLEMPGEQLFDRLVCMVAGLDSQKFREAKLSKEEEARYYATKAELETLNIYIDDEPSVTPMNLRRRCRRSRYEEGVDIIFVDYLQLLEPDDAKAAGNKVASVDQVSRSLKLIARELDIPIVALGQLNRKLEERQDQRPLLSDIQYGGEAHADYVIGLHNPTAKEELAVNPLPQDRPQARILKNRNGPIGDAYLLWATSYFVDDVEPTYDEIPLAI